MSKSWPMVPLGELITLERRPAEVTAEGIYPEVGVYCFGKGLFFKQPRTGMEVGDKKLFYIRERDFILQVTFAWEGAVAVAPKEAEKYFGSVRVLTYRANETRCIPEFLLQYFRTREGVEKLGEICPGSAGRNRVLNVKQLPRITIPLPPITEQRRLVAHIDALAGKISEVGEASRKLELNQQTLLTGLYSQLVANAPYKKLGEIAPLTRRPATIDPCQEYPGVSVRSFGRGTFHNPPLPGSEITWEKPHLVKAGDILISNIKAWEGAIAVATADDDNRYGSHRYLTFVPSPNVVTSRWLCFHLLTPQGLHYVGEASPGSADRNRTTSATGLQEIPVPMPRYEQQVWFGKIYDKIDAIRQTQVVTATAREKLLPAILNEAFNGQRLS
jgi:type I restriction enzyme, S subunit